MLHGVIVSQYRNEWHVSGKHLKLFYKLNGTVAYCTNLRNVPVLSGVAILTQWKLANLKRLIVNTRPYEL